MRRLRRWRVVKGGLGCGCSPNCFEVITVYYRLNNFMRIKDNRFMQAAIIILAVVASALAGAGAAMLLVRW